MAAKNTSWSVTVEPRMWREAADSGSRGGGRTRCCRLGRQRVRTRDNCWIVDGEKRAVEARGCEHFKSQLMWRLLVFVLAGRFMRYAGGCKGKGLFAKADFFSKPQGEELGIFWVSQRGRPGRRARLAASSVSVYVFAVLLQVT